MATAPATTRGNLETDLRLVSDHTALGVVSSRTRSSAHLWTIWTDFCRSVNADPFCQTLSDPIPLLQVFALRYRTGDLSASGRAVRKRQVEEALRAVGQTLAGLGLPDPRLTHFSDKLDFRLRRQLATYQRADPAPARVKPVPLPVLQLGLNGLSSPSHQRMWWGQTVK